MDINRDNLFVQRDMGIYIHIPFCKQKCIYCDFPAYQNLQDYYDTYIYALLQEIRLFGQTYPNSRTKPVDTIYFGGGTPTELSLNQLESIIQEIRQNYRILPNCELSIESNPGEVTKDYLHGLKNLGFSRISFGVQTFKDSALLALHRSHTGKEAIEAIEWAYDVGFSNINLDLIYGLPNQTLDDIQHNLNIASRLPINHISTYGLQVEKGTYLYHLVSKDLLSLPDEDLEDSMYEAMMSGIQSLGFERYEISNFAKDNAYSTHNLKYWQYCDYLGFGVGAHSFFESTRRGNNRNVMPYARMIDCYELPIVEEDVITTERAMEDYCFLGLRTKWGIMETAFWERFNTQFMDIFGHIVTPLLENHLLERTDIGVKLTPKGAKQGNYVFSQFLRD